jgi:hypothetical protein
MQMTASPPARSSNLPDADPARRAPATHTDWIGRSFIGGTSLAWFTTFVLSAVEIGEPLHAEAFTVGMIAVALTVLTSAVKLRRVIAAVTTEVGQARRRDWWAGYRESAVSFQRAETGGEDEDQRVY